MSRTITSHTKFTYLISQIEDWLVVFFILRIPIEYACADELSSSSEDAEEELFMDVCKLQCEYIKFKVESEEKQLRKEKRLFIGGDFKLAAKTVHGHYFSDNPNQTPEHFWQ